VLQCVAVCCGVLLDGYRRLFLAALQCVAGCSIVSQCVAVCCSELQCASACCSVLLDEFQRLFAAAFQYMYQYLDNLKKMEKILFFNYLFLKTIFFPCFLEI